MAANSIEINSEVSKLIPRPILHLGVNYFLQHQRSFDINSFMSNSYNSSNYSQIPTITQTGADWANDNLKVGISYAHGDYTFFKENTPMVFLEVDNKNGKSNYNKHLNRTQWTHPVNIGGTLNRVGSSYGGGDAVTGLTTEWDFTATEFQDQVIELNQKLFYRDNTITLPLSKVDFVTNVQNTLKYQNSRYGSSVLPGIYNVNTFYQPIRFRFGIIDPEDGKSIILGEPSDELLLGVKGGYFEPQDDYYYYDWTLKFK